MQRLRWLVSAMALAILLGAAPVRADDADRLAEAIRLHESGQHAEAREILARLDASTELSDEQQGTVGRYLLLVDQAIGMQKKADADLVAGEAALRVDDRFQARKRFTDVTMNPYASASQRSQAEKHLRTLDQQSGGTVNIRPNTPKGGTMQPGTSSSGSQPMTRGGTPITTRQPSPAPVAQPLPAGPMRQADAGSSFAPPAGGGDARLVDQLARENELLWQKAEATYRELEKEIRMAVLDGDFDEAYRMLDVARQTIEANRRYASPASRYDDLRNQLRGLEGFVEDEERQFNEDQIREKVAEVEQREAERIALIQETKGRQVEQLMERATELRKERRLREAIQVLEQVLAIEPEHEQALWMVETLEDLAQSISDREAVRARHNETRDLLIENDWSGVPYHDDMTYPKNWPEITARRKSQDELRESEETRKARSKLRTPAPEINFDAMEFEEVLARLKALTGLNIVANWPALEAVAIEKDAEVSLNLTDVSYQKVLDLVLSTVSGGEVDLGYEIDEGIIRISTKEDLSRRTLVRVYNIQDLIISVPTFRGPEIEINQIGQGSQEQGGIGGGRFIEGGGAGGAGGGAGQNLFQDNPVQDDEEEEGDPLQPIIDLIQQTIDPESWREAGGNVGSISTLNQQLVVTQTSSNHQQLQDLLRQLRQARALQIAVEARYITISRNWLEQIGVDLDVVLNNGNAGFDQTTILHPATNNPILVPRQFVRNGFTPGAPGGVGITLPTQPFGHPFGQPGLTPAPTGSPPYSSQFTPIPIVNNTLSLASPSDTNIAGSLGSLLNDQPAFQIFGSFLDNIQVDFLIRASQVDRRASGLDAPRLVLFNGQRATFESFIEQDYIAALTPVIGDNAGAFQPRVQTALTGRALDVQATVSADRRYVTMTIRTFTRVTGDFRTVFFGGSQTVGSGFIELASQTTQRVRTTVSVPDGGTLLIGGLKQSGERDVDAGVPILSRIPVLKRAFSNTSNVKDDQVLLILIKPTIIIQEEAEADAFPTLSSLEREEF